PRRSPGDGDRPARRRAGFSHRRAPPRRRAGDLQRVLEPRVQCHAVHAGERLRAADVVPARRPAVPVRRRHGNRHRERAHPPPDGALLPRRSRPRARHRRHRSRSRHRQARAAAARGSPRDREHARRGQRVHLRVPAGARHRGRRVAATATVTGLSHSRNLPVMRARTMSALRETTKGIVMNLKHLASATLAVALAAASGGAFAQAAVDPHLPVYEKASGVSGNLSSVGSDTLANLMTLWAEEYKRLYPNVNIQVQAAGSSTAPPALTEGTSNLGPMSRPMKDGEIQAFEQKHGYRPLEIPVAIDALAVFVHRDNPIEGLTLAQVDAIFSSTRRCG